MLCQGGISGGTKSSRGILLGPTSGKHGTFLPHLGVAIVIIFNQLQSRLGGEVRVNTS